MDDENTLRQAEPDPLWSSTAPWAMQLALEDDRQHRPTHLEVCEAAAAAVVALLRDPRALSDDGEWHARVEHWASGPIRKVVRRGRGVRFQAVQALPGVLVERGARVRAFVPGPTDQVPASLAKLQVGGTDQPERGTSSAAASDGVTIALTPLVPMTTGKAAAQSGHAAQLALMAMEEPTRKAWEEAGWPVRVVLPAETEWRALARTAAVSVRDGGFTEVAPGTQTALAWWGQQI